MVDVDTMEGRTENAARLRYLEPGMELSVSDLTDTLGGYSCRLVRADSRTLWVSLPMRRDGMLNLSEGQLVSVRFDRPDDAVYLFDSVVAERRPDDDAPFGIARPVTINRRPQRASTRLALVLDATYVVDGQGEYREGTVVDVSAGGVGLICAHDLDEGTELRICCALPGDGEEIAIDEQARVRSRSLYGRTPAGATLFHYGVRFVDIDDETRERILDTIIWNLTAHHADG